MPPKRCPAAHADKRFALFSLAMTIVAVLGMAVFTVLGKYGAALGLGLAAGTLLFMRGTLAGGRLGNARAVGQSGKDAIMRLGACLALAGMAAAVQAHDPPLAWPVRAVIDLGQLIASVLAVWLAAQQAKQGRSLKETQGRDDITAKRL